jgi:hypothetical protein
LLEGVVDPVSGAMIVLDVSFGRHKPSRIDGSLLMVVVVPAIETGFTGFVKRKSSKQEAAFDEDVASGTATVLANERMLLLQLQQTCLKCLKYISYRE